MTLYYTDRCVLNGSGLVCEGPLSLISIQATFTGGNGYFNLWSAMGPSGGVYKGTFRAPYVGTCLFNFGLPVREADGLYVEFGDHIDEVIMILVQD